MSILILKLILTPVLIGLASLAGRRWGPSVGGWLVGLPLTSAPVTFFLALDHGTQFAASTSIGILAATLSQSVFALTYARFALRSTWMLSLLAATIIFLTSTALLKWAALPLLPAAVIAFGSLVGGLALIPRVPRLVGESMSLPAWDIPARMVVATALVFLLTGLAPRLGAVLTGLLTPFPLYAGILTVFAHRLQDPDAAINVLTGLLNGLFAFCAFFLVLAISIEPLGIGPAFLLAVPTALVVQALSLLRLSRPTLSP